MQLANKVVVVVVFGARAIKRERRPSKQSQCSTRSYEITNECTYESDLRKH